MKRDRTPAAPLSLSAPPWHARRGAGAERPLVRVFPLDRRDRETGYMQWAVGDRRGRRIRSTTTIEGKLSCPLAPALIHISFEG